MVETSTRAVEKSNEQPEGGLEPNAMRIVWAPKNSSKDEDGRITKIYLDGGDMGGLVRLDGSELLDGDLCGRETGIGKVRLLEFGQCLFVELRLEILEDESKI